jgi:branched-chain amino acid transport system permease protein
VRLRASRENEAAARSVGIKIPIERGVAWVLSAFVMGVGGALYSHYIIAFSAGEFYFAATFNIVLMLVLGGMTSVSGAVVGVLFVTILKETLRKIENGPLDGAYPGFTELLLAAVLLLILIWRPRGLTAGHEIPWPGDWRPPREWFKKRRFGGNLGPTSIGDASVQPATAPAAAPDQPAERS